MSDEKMIMKINLRNIPVPLKALFSFYLLTMGIAYVIALLYLFLIDV